MEVIVFKDLYMNGLVSWLLFLIWLVRFLVMYLFIFSVIWVVVGYGCLFFGGIMVVMLLMM